MEIIDVEINEEGTIEFDLGGDLDGTCCGHIQKEINERLKALGIDLRMISVLCRLPKREMRSARAEGQCVVESGEKNLKQKS